MTVNIDLGWFSLCFDVDTLEHGLEYYGKLGFRQVKADFANGWCMVSNGHLRMTFFLNDYIKKTFGVTHLMNFRGTDVLKLSKTVKEHGIVPFEDASLFTDGSVDMTIKDPFNNVLFIDCHPSEATNDPRNDGSY